MLNRVSGKKQFVAAIADIKAGNALAKGKTEPLVPQTTQANRKLKK